MRSLLIALLGVIATGCAGSLATTAGSRTAGEAGSDTRQLPVYVHEQGQMVFENDRVVESSPYRACSAYRVSAGTYVTSASAAPTSSVLDPDLLFLGSDRGPVRVRSVERRGSLLVIRTSGASSDDAAPHSEMIQSGERVVSSAHRFNESRNPQLHADASPVTETVEVRDVRSTINEFDTIVLGRVGEEGQYRCGAAIHDGSGNLAGIVIGYDESGRIIAISARSVMRLAEVQ